MKWLKLVYLGDCCFMCCCIHAFVSGGNHTLTLVICSSRTSGVASFVFTGLSFGCFGVFDLLVLGI